MKRESLIGIRTMREVDGSLDLARRSTAAKGQLRVFHQQQEREKAIPVVDRDLTTLLRRDEERRRRQEAMSARCYNKILATRAKLLTVKQRNEQLMEHRYRAERARWMASTPAGLHHVEQGKGVVCPTRESGATRTGRKKAPPSK